jgi:preprotein translocase subunit SecY
MDDQRVHELRNRTLVTVLVVAVYLFFRTIVLYGVSVDDATARAADAPNILSMMLSGDRYRITVMALGVAPYINASLLVQIVFAFRSASSRAKISKMQHERWRLATSVAFALVMAIMLSFGLTYEEGAGPLWALRLISIVEVFAGAMLTNYLCIQNERHGVGASMSIILVNILTSLVQTMDVNHFLSFPWIWLLCAVAVGGTVYMENSLVRLPLQRVSIHNVHADQNYLAYKRSPMGIMPVMFAASAFLLPYYFIGWLAYLFPNNASIAFASEHMALTDPLGAAVYLLLIVVLSVFFSFLMLNPKDTAHQLQRNGDSIIGVYAGGQTERYLSGIVLRWSLISGVLQAVCMAVSLALSLQGEIPAALALIPASVMIVASICCSLYQEITAYYRYDAYRFFM